MRISDWSSDVCSSDLIVIGVGRQHAHARGRPVLAHLRHLAGHQMIVIDVERVRPLQLGAPPGRIVRARHRAERPGLRSEEHTSELQSLMRISYAVFCLKKKKTDQAQIIHRYRTHITMKLRTIQSI